MRIRVCDNCGSHSTEVIVKREYIGDGAWISICSDCARVRDDELAKTPENERGDFEIPKQ